MGYYRSSNGTRTISLFVLLLAILGLVPLEQANAVGPIFNDDFESGKKGQWTYDACNTEANAVTEIHDGIYKETPTHSLYISNLYGNYWGQDNGVAYATLDINELSLTIPYTFEFWFYPSKSAYYPYYNCWIILETNQDINLWMSNDPGPGHITLHDGDGWRLITELTPSFALQSWNKIKYTRTGANSYRLQINDETVWTGDPYGDSLSDIPTFILFGDRYPDFAKGEAYWDDILICSGTYDLTITPTSGGTTDPNVGTYTYPYGFSVEVTAIPYECYEFDHWKVDVNYVNSANPISLVMDSNHTLEAVFVQIEYDLTVTPTTGGTTEPNVGTYTYGCGSVVEVNAIPEGCYEFDHWELDGNNVDSNNPYSVVMDSNHALYAFFTCEASVPSPADEAEDVATDVVLSWTPACCANSHDVYFGTSFAEVNNANTTAPEFKSRQPLSDVNYVPGVLEFNTTYYWRIDEVNDPHPNSPWKGDVWMFTVGHIVVDDFDSYANDSELWAVWDDQWVNGSGAEIFLEQDPQHTRDGNSMRYVYNSAYSSKGMCYGSVADTDTTRLGIGSDWTVSGVEALVLYFYGDPCNSATADDQLWLQLEDTNSNSGLVLYDDPNDVNEPTWHEWNIDLGIFDACGVSLTNIEKLHIGFGGATVGGNCKAGGTGTVWVDDIRLYPPRCRPEFTGFAGDITGEYGDPDCLVDSHDLRFLGLQWVTSGPEADLSGDSIVNFLDYDILAQDWLEGPILWP